MRVSTAMMYALGSDAITRQYAELARTQQQLSSGKRVLSAADDPVAAAAVMRTVQAGAINAGFKAAQGAAVNSLALAESALGSTGDLLQSAQQLLISAQSGALNARDRASIAGQLDGMLTQLVGLANARDGAGNYLFAGYAETTQPFAQAAGGVVYQGDDGIRALEVAPGRLLGVSASGADIFMRVKTGNGVFASAPDAANTGAGMIDSGSVVNPAALTGSAYRITFNVAAGVTTYDVQDVTAGTTVSTGNAFAPGQAITIAGMQVAVSSAPGAGDRFDLMPAAKQSVFATLAAAAAALRGGANAAIRVSQVNSALANLSQALDQSLTVRSELGGRLAEIETHKGVAEAAGLEHQRRQSELQDLDYAEASTRLARQQTALEAAQQSFARIARLSLFNYLN